MHYFKKLMRSVLLVIILVFFPAFAFGSVTLDGLHIATYFETITTETCESEIFILVYVMHLLFTFVQTFFIFKNHKVTLC